MTTYAEKMRTLLAEVDPTLAALVQEPPPDLSWSKVRVRYGRTRAQYETLWRAQLLLAERAGRTFRYCFECSWRAHSTRDRQLRERLVLDGCEHVVEEADR